MEQTQKSKTPQLKANSGRERILQEAEEEQKRGERPIVYLRDFPMPQRFEESQDSEKSRSSHTQQLLL